MKNNFKNTCYSLLKRFEKSYFTLVTMSLLMTLAISPSFAADPKLVTGTRDLFRAATGWALIVIPVGAGFYLTYISGQKALTEDQAVIAEKNKLMKNVLIGAAIAVTASGLVNVVLAFYQ